MARTFPVPVCTTTSVAGSADQRTLSVTSPGTTDSTATNCTNNLGPTGWIMVPEKAGSQQGSTTAPTPYPVSALWMLAINPALAPAGAAVTIAAGTWTIPVHYSRAGGLLTGDVLGTFTAVLIRTDGSSNLGEIGRATGAQVTVGTAEASQNISVSGAAVSLQPGEFVALGIFCVHNGALLGGDTIRVHTNSATALRITAAPAYTIQYTGSHVEVLAVSELHTRRADYFRNKTETVPVPADSHSDFATYRRYQSESVPTPSDVQTRQVAFTRPQNESVPTPADAHARTATYLRQQSESALVTEGHTRKASYVRVQNEVLSSGGGVVINNYFRPVYLFDD